LAVVEGRLKRLLGQAGIPLDGFYYCPHHPQGSVARYVGACECRKPEPGLLIRATTENGLDRANSWAIGDILNDVEAGHRAGCKSVLIDNGNETEWVLAPLREPEYTARDLVEAACMILADEKQGDRFLNHLNGGGHPQ
jgi:histidinol phosphatase-like enzyme